MHNDQPKPNLRRKRKALSGLKVLLEIVGLEVTAEGVRIGTHSESWRERILYCRSCDAETVISLRLENVVSTNLRKACRKLQALYRMATLSTSLAACS